MPTHEAAVHPDTFFAKPGATQALAHHLRLNAIAHLLRPPDGRRCGAPRSRQSRAFGASSVYGRPEGLGGVEAEG